MSMEEEDTNTAVILNQALASAKYNELITLNAGGEVDRTIVLTARLDSANGGITFFQVPEDDVLRKHLQTKLWFLPMLHDVTRNKKYEKAIALACDDLVSELVRNPEILIDNDNTTAISCLDIGTGSGLLSMLVAHHLQKAIHSNQEFQKKYEDKAIRKEIIAVEMDQAMVKLAKMNLARNKGHQTKKYNHKLPNDKDVIINFAETHSCSPEFILNQKALICTSELLESSALNEGIIPTIKDAWNRHLFIPKDETFFQAIVIPSKLTVHAVLVTCIDSLFEATGPKEYEDPVSVKFHTGGKGAPKVIHVHAESLINEMLYLSDNQAVLEFDFSDKNAPLPSENSLYIDILKEGVIQAVLFYWELDIYKGIKYSTEMGKQPWQNHWLQNLFVFPQDDRLNVVKGQRVRLVASHNDTNMSFSVKEVEENRTNKKMKSSDESSFPVSIDEFLEFCSPDRTIQLNDFKRLSKFHASIEEALKAKGHGVVVLDLSDFSFVSIIAAQCGAQNVISIESSTSGMPWLSAKVAQFGNNLTDSDSFCILNCYPENLTLSDFNDNRAQIVVAEPYYEKLENFHLLECMNFFFIVRSLQKRSIVDPNALYIPCKARVMACLIESEKIYNAHKRLDGPILGFDHEVFNCCHDHSGGVEFNLPAWQYDFIKLSNTYVICEFDIAKAAICDKKVEMIFTQCGQFHAVLLWLDYELSPSQKLSTLSPGHSAIVRLNTNDNFLTIDEEKIGLVKVKCSLNFDSSATESKDYDISVEITNGQ